MPEEMFYSIREVAKIYGVSWRAVKYHIEKGHIVMELVESEPVMAISQAQVDLLRDFIGKKRN